MTLPKEIIASWIEQIHESGNFMTPFEEKLLDKATKSFRATGEITDREEELLRQIFKEKTK